MPFPNLFGLQRRQPARDCFGRLRLWFMSPSVFVPHNVALSRALQRVGCSSGLCRSLKMIFPSREDQHGGMAL